MNVTLWPGGKLIGRLNPLRLNPEPLTLAREIVTVEARSLLVKVSYCVCVLPTGIFPKLTLDELKSSERAEALPVAEARNNAIVKTPNRGR